jgi:hypothetical protein
MTTEATTVTSFTDENSVNTHVVIELDDEKNSEALTSAKDSDKVYYHIKDLISYGKFRTTKEKINAEVASSNASSFYPGARVYFLLQVSQEIKDRGYEIKLTDAAFSTGLRLRQDINRKVTLVKEEILLFKELNEEQSLRYLPKVGVGHKQIEYADDANITQRLNKVQLEFGKLTAKAVSGTFPAFAKVQTTTEFDRYYVDTAGTTSSTNLVPDLKYGEIYSLGVIVEYEEG